LLSASFANIIAGIIAGFTSGDAGYEGTFMMIVKVALGVSVVLFLLTPLLKKLVGKKF
jgi:dipeptide/tripeptide permease